MSQHRITERPRGRPTLFTPERRQAFLDAVAVGAPRTVAAKAAGWTHVWKPYLADGYTYGEEGMVRHLTDREQAFVDFIEQVEQLESLRIQRNLAVIISAAEVDGAWQAAAWLCERTHPAEFARRTGVEVTGKDGEPLALEIKMGDLLDALAKLKPGEAAVPPTNGRGLRALPSGEPGENGA